MNKKLHLFLKNILNIKSYFSYDSYGHVQVLKYFFNQISELQDLLKQLFRKRLMMLQEAANKDNLTNVSLEVVMVVEVFE